MQVKPFKYSYYLHIPTKNKRGKEKKGNAKNENLTKKAGGHWSEGAGGEKEQTNQVKCCYS